MDLALERLQSLNVADVMNRQVVLLPVDYSLAETARLFVEHEISSAPVVDASGQCVGILSATDFVRRASKIMQQPQALSPDQAKAREHMTTAVQSIAPEAPILAAARIMNAQHVHRLLVLDRHSRPIGVISSMDIVAALVNAMDEMGANHEDGKEDLD